MSTDRDDDDYKRLAYDGSRGPLFRTFKRDLFARARGRFSKDDRYSYYQAYTRTDEGGTNGGPALPAQAGGVGGGVNAQYTIAITKRAIRHGQAFTFLYDMTTDERIKQMLSDLADTNPAELAGEAWDLLVGECDEPDDDLELSHLNKQWENASIMNSVGHSLSTVTDFARTLNNMNGKRPQGHRFDENAVYVKFLSCINHPESLAKDAAKELRARGASREFKRGANNDRALQPMVKYFDEMWRSLFTSHITPRAAQTGQQHVNTLVAEDEHDHADAHVQAHVLREEAPAQDGDGERADGDAYLID